MPRVAPPIPGADPLLGRAFAAVMPFLIDVGMMVGWAGSEAKIPARFLPADGRKVLASRYPDLARAIGTTNNTGGEQPGEIRLPTQLGFIVCVL